MAARHGFEVAHEQIVDALTRVLLGDGAPLDRAFYALRPCGDLR